MGTRVKEPASPPAGRAEPSPAPPPRLFQTTGARVTPQVEWAEVQVKSVLNRVQGMPFKWSINPYRGCAFGCRYCFARVTHWYLNQDGVNDWSSRIFVKKNAPEVLRRELSKPTWSREHVHIGTATDPYQPAEGAYRITRQILEALRDFKTPAALVTKSTMIVRDRDVLRQLAQGPGAFVFFSITTVDPTLAKEIEPDVPPPQRRLEAMRALAEAGIRTGVLLAPVLPRITDDEEHLAAVVTAAKAYGASALSTNTLYLGDVTRQAFFGYLERKRPELVPEYERLYRGKYAPRATQHRIEEVVAALKARAGFTVAPPRRMEAPQRAQLRLL
ncbi:MAG: radical SAM protein [bacterium]